MTSSDVKKSRRMWGEPMSRGEGLDRITKSSFLIEPLTPIKVFGRLFDLVFLGCNSNFAKLNGLEKPTSIIGRSGFELNWDKDVAVYIDERERNVIVNNKPELNIVESLITPDGNQSWYEINRIPLHDLKDSVVGILVTYEDITERKTADQKIKASEEKYRGILENIKETYFEVDIDGTFTFFNDSFIDLMGYQREEIMGVNFQNFVDEENRNKIIEAYTEVFETEKPRSTFKFQFENKNGNSVICESSVYLRYDPNGKKIGFSGIARDITEQYLLEKKLKESEKRYHHLFESSPYAIWLMDENGIIIDCNSTIKSLLSVLKIEDIIGKKFTDVLKHLQRPEDIISVLTDRFDKFLKGDKLGPLEVQITRLDG